MRMIRPLSLGSSLALLVQLEIQELEHVFESHDTPTRSPSTTMRRLLPVRFMRDSACRASVWEGMAILGRASGNLYGYCDPVALHPDTFHSNNAGPHPVDVGTATIESCL